jgi:hypothetical protein
MSHFSKLPIETQRQIPTADRSMFSIQQLYLNLNRVGLSGTPEIMGTNKNGTTAKYLSEIFLKQYLNSLDKDVVILGYSVVSNKAYHDRASLVPTSMNFVTSYASRLSYAVAVATMGPVRAGAVVIMTAANVCTAGLHAASAVAISRDL